MGQTPAVGGFPAPQRQRARVLVLEDDIPFRHVLVELLEGEAFDVAICTTYASLREHVREDRSCIVLADFWGTSHVELSPSEQDEIRQLGQRVPTILLSGRAWATNTDAADLALVCILVKPVALDEILEQLRRCLARAQDAKR
jgi:DNA-binding NtrC family response regulator